jgi:hypothetical protein
MLRRFAFLSLFSLCVLVPSVAAAQTQPVTIAWDANTEPGVIGYRVYVGTAPSVYSQVFDAGAQTQFTYQNGLSGQRYYFAVSAYAAGPLEGPRSSEVSTVIGGSTGGSTGGGSTGGSTGGGSTGGGSTGGGGGGGGGAPTGSTSGGTPTVAGADPVAPSGPVGPAVVLQPALVGGGMVTLSWSPVGGLTASEYLLEAGTAPGLSNLYNASVGAVTALSAQVGNGTYFVRVRGRGLDGAITAPSNEISFLVGAAGQATCSAPPTPPVGLAGSIAGTQASVQWTAGQGATSYLVQAGSAPGLSDVYYGNVGAVVSVSAEVQPGFSAYVRVVAVNGCGQSAPSTEIFMQ